LDTRSASSERTDAQVAVVVLNWNGGDDTLACLESLQASAERPYVIVVDNGSTDDSLSRIEASALADEIVATRDNLGYAAGNNVGLRRALDGQFAVIAVMNNDTVVAPDALELLREQLAGPTPLALSPDIRYFDRSGESWFAGGVVDRGWPRHLQAVELVGDERPLRPSQCLSGCCIVARRETWEQVGPFDPRYFLIFEDSDWSMRAVQHGVELYVVTASTIRHRVSSSFERGPASLLGNYYFVRNGLRFEARYFARHLPRFVVQWLVRPAPGLIRARHGDDLVFRWLGALAFATGRTGRAPRSIHSLAARLAGRTGRQRSP
jgi:GT2 family glycosyltransferase